MNDICGSAKLLDRHIITIDYPIIFQVPRPSFTATSFLPPIVLLLLFDRDPTCFSLC